MISHKYKCIFIHIPRCGGSSIEDIIWPGKRKTEDLWMGFVSKYHNKYQTGGLQHLFGKHVEIEVGHKIFSEYFKFSFVRNPWDRAVSQFHFMKRRPDLREFIGLRLDDPFRKYLDLIRKKRHVQWEEQHKFIMNDHGEFLVDFQGRFENYKQDVGFVLEKLGLSGKAVPHVNRTPHSAYQEYYDEESMEIVRLLYKRDIALFGYSFSPNSADVVSHARSASDCTTESHEPE
jgi:hypothetical protein